MTTPLLTDENLKDFINSLKISEDQKKFLFNELPMLNEKERLEMLETLKDVYLLNEEEKQVMEKISKQIK